MAKNKPKRWKEKIRQIFPIIIAKGKVFLSFLRSTNLKSIKAGKGGYIFLLLAIWGFVALILDINTMRSATTLSGKFSSVGAWLFAFLLLFVLAKGIKRYRNRDKSDGKKPAMGAKKKEVTGPFLGPLLQATLVNGVTWAIVLWAIAHLLWPGILGEPNILWIAMAFVILGAIFEGAETRSRMSAPEKKVASPALKELSGWFRSLRWVAIVLCVGYFFVYPAEWDTLTAQKGQLSNRLEEYSTNRALEAATPRTPNIPQLTGNDAKNWKVNVRVWNTHLNIPDNIIGNFPFDGYITNEVQINVQGAPITLLGGNCGYTYRSDIPRPCTGNWRINNSPFAGTYRLYLRGDGNQFIAELYNGPLLPHDPNTKGDIELAAARSN